MAQKNLNTSLLAVIFCSLLAACDPLSSATSHSPPIAPVQEISLVDVVSSQLAPLAFGDRQYLLLASAQRGLVLLNRDGGEATSLDGGSVGHFAMQLQDDGSWLVAAFDENSGEIQLRQLSFDETAQKPALHYLGAKAVGAPQVAMCFSRQAGRTHLFTIDENGLGYEYLVHPRDLAWQFSEVRPLYFGEQISSCVVDDRRGRLLVAQPPLGIWSLNASAEEDEERRVFAPGSALSGRFGGFWLDYSSDMFWLVAGARVLAYNLQMAEPAFSHALAETELVSVAVQDGSLLALEAGGNLIRRYVVDLPRPVAQAQALDGPPEIPRVAARAQTQPVASGGDAADDPAIWVNPRNTAASLIFGTDKKSGLNVYDLSGKLREHFAVGRVHNVDLRSLRYGRFSALAAASNRSESGIDLFGITASGRVEHLGLREMALQDPRGLCLYRNGDELLAWISDKSGDLHLVEIIPGDTGFDWRLHPRKKMRAAGRVEDCVVDDEHQRLFFSEGDSGVWSLDIAGFLSDQAQPRLIAAVDGAHLVANVEGLGLYRSGEQSYLVVSSQGNNSYALFSLDGSQFIGHFRVDINLDLGLDGSSETDGLEVTGAVLGADYPQGLLIVQDGRNRMPSAAQNFKLVSWADIAEKLELP